MTDQHTSHRQQQIPTTAVARPESAAASIGAEPFEEVLVPGSRLNLLASAVRNGRYRVDPLDVAEAMIPFVHAMR